MSQALHIERLCVALADQEIVSQLDLELEAGSYGVILGPSGAGKSTLLRAIAGLVDASGRITIGQRQVCDGGQLVRPEERDIGFLFQGLALWPHMTVRGHLDFALAGRGVPRGERGVKIRETLEPLLLLGMEGKRPGALSGGERQRLALARALVTRPGLLLLDEPTSSVDPRTAQEVHEFLEDVNDTFGATVLHVTHDQSEALALADTVFVLDEGVILQHGSPEDLYQRPLARMVANFIGSGGIIPGVVNVHGRADTPLGSVPLNAERSMVQDGSQTEGAVWVLARPEDLAVVPEGDGVPADVRRVTYKGGHWQATVSVSGHALQVDLDRPVACGDRLRIRVERPLWVVESRIET